MSNEPKVDLAGVDELVGRLTAETVIGEDPPTKLIIDGKEVVCAGSKTTMRRNPDGPEAATALQSLAAQLAEKDALLRECEEALSAISRAVGDWDCRIYASDTEMRHARAILDKIKGSQQ